jgi:Zn-dependent protease/CBS domain-containing protein
MMGSNLYLGKIFGVPIKLSFSWFLIFMLITWSLASGYLPDAYPMLNPLTYWLIGAATAILFAGSVLLHELGHVYLALRNGVPVRGVTLFLFGGVAELQKEPDSPAAEFRIAIAGPLVSLSLAAVFALIWLFARTVPLLAAPSEYLMRINFILAFFNLIPGFPLDGGRVLRAAVWKVTGSSYRATRIASGSGQVISLGFFGVGIFMMLQGNFFNGLWLAFIGWFLQNAASAAFLQANVQQALTGTLVEHVMRRDFEQVPSLISIDQFVKERIIQGKSDVYLVSDLGMPQGLLTIQEIASIPQRKWPFTTLRQVMMPIERVLTISPEMNLLAALQKMESARVGQAKVIIQNEIIGLLSVDDAMRYIRRRSQLRI